LATGTVPEIDGLHMERKDKATPGDTKNCDTLYALAGHKYSLMPACYLNSLLAIYTYIYIYIYI